MTYARSNGVGIVVDNGVSGSRIGFFLYNNVKDEEKHLNHTYINVRETYSKLNQSDTSSEYLMPIKKKIIANPKYTRVDRFNIY